MIAGISEAQEKIIIDILKSYFADFSFYYYGSRVKGGFEATSDLDILIKAKTNPKQTKIPSAILEEIKEKFDQSNLPFVVNFSEFANVDDGFYEMIRGNLVRVDWKKEKLSKIAYEVRDGYQPKASDNFIYIGLEHIEQQSLRLCGKGLSSEIKSTKRHFQNNDILFGSLRPYFRKVVKPKFSGICSTDITVIRANPDVSNQGFLYYLIADESFINHASNIANGSRMPRANWQVLSKSEWVIPNSLETQQKIAGILSAYDDLIENNNKRIKILEEMAQMLYKEWFVDFKFPNHQNTKFVDSEFGKIPEGWEVVDLDKKIDIRKGKNITKNTVKDGNIPVVAGGLSPAYYHNEFNTEAPVITVSASGANAGYVNLYHSNIWASDCSFIDKKTTPFVCFYYLFLKNKQIEITGLQRGSAQPHVYPKDLMGLKIFNIPNSLISGFEEKILPIFLLLKNLDQKNTHLKQTRDLLLPRLISGELSVENLQVKYNERTQH